MAKVAEHIYWAILSRMQRAGGGIAYSKFITPEFKTKPNQLALTTENLSGFIQF